MNPENPILEFYLLPASPVLALFVFGTLLIILDCIFKYKACSLKFLTALLGPVVSIYFTWLLHISAPLSFSTVGFSGDPQWLMEFSKQYLLDHTTLSFFWAINIFTFFGIVFMRSQFKDRSEFSECLILLEFIASGMMVLVSANSLLMIFLGLELLSLPTYVLTGIRRSDKYSSEAALKYFLFGSLASVFLVLGSTLLYAHFGTTKLPEIAELLKTVPLTTLYQRAFVYGGASLLLIAGLFKVGIVPFHMWVPDTYQGAPTSITGFMGSAVKLAGFGLLIRIFWGMLLPVYPFWSQTLAVLAVVTMFVGNIAALAQTDLKRLFAYSSISHAGYLLLGVAAFAGQAPNSQILYYYLTVYGFMFLGFFGLLFILEQQTKSTRIEQLSGLGITHPWLGACFSLFALSAAGIPPTSGFLAKYFIFMEAVHGGKTLFVVLAVISSLIGLYYYLRILVFLYMKEGLEQKPFKPTDRMAWFSVLACAFCVLYFSLFPSRLGL